MKKETEWLETMASHGFQVTRLDLQSYQHFRVCLSDLQTGFAFLLDEKLTK